MLKVITLRVIAKDGDGSDQAEKTRQSDGGGGDQGSGNREGELEKRRSEGVTERGRGWDEQAS